MKPFHKAARWFTIGIDPFVRLGDVLRVGTWTHYIEKTPPAFLTPDLLEILNDLDHVPKYVWIYAWSFRFLIFFSRRDIVENNKKLFKLILGLVGGFETVLNELCQDPNKFLIFCNFVRLSFISVFHSFYKRLDDYDCLQRTL